MDEVGTELDKIAPAEMAIDVELVWEPPCDTPHRVEPHCPSSLLSAIVGGLIRAGVALPVSPAAHWLSPVVAGTAWIATSFGFPYRDAALHALGLVKAWAAEASGNALAIVAFAGTVAASALAWRIKFPQR